MENNEAIIVNKNEVMGVIGDNENFVCIINNKICTNIDTLITNLTSSDDNDVYIIYLLDKTNPIIE